MSGAAARVEALVREVEALEDPHARARARALVSAVLELHHEGLDALLGALAPEVRQGLAGDAKVASLLLLHGLHPVPLAERVRAALGGIDAQLRGLGATVTDVAVGEATVRVRVGRDDPSRHGAHIQRLLEEALLEAAPEAEAVLEGVEDQAALVPTGRLVR